jgi:type IV pilus assembly protein PilN
MPVHLLNELVAQVPDGVYLTSMKQTNDRVAISGVAQSNERVSELLRNLGSNSPWLTRPELVEIVAGTVNLTPKDVRRVANFKVNVQLLRASEAQKAASAAAASAALVPTSAKPGPAATLPASAAVAAATPASAKK